MFAKHVAAKIQGFFRPNAKEAAISADSAGDDDEVKNGAATPRYVRQWAELAGLASSAHNLQPWALEIREAQDRREACVFLNDETRRHTSALDLDWGCSFSGLGCFAENLIQIASSSGYALTELRCVPGDRLEETCFQLRFVGSPDRRDDDAFQAMESKIQNRHVNRFPYLSEPLRAAHVLLLKSVVARFPGIEMKRANRDIEKTARLLALAEVGLLRYPVAFREFLEGFRFGKDARRMTEGLHPRTLGVPLPGRMFIRLLKSFPSLRVLFYIGFERIYTYLGVVRPLTHSSDLIFISIHDESPEGWFQLGRCLEAVWLELNERGVSVQPMLTGALLLYRESRERSGTGATCLMPASVRRHLSRVRERMQRELGFELTQPTLAFRVGYGPSLPRISHRRAPDVEYY